MTDDKAALLKLHRAAVLAGIVRAELGPTVNDDLKQHLTDKHDAAEAAFASALNAALSPRTEGWVPREPAEKLAKAVGAVLTWAHKAEGVAIVREEYLEALRPAAIELYDAINAAAPAEQP